MKILVFCFALFLPHVLSDHPMNVQVTDHHQCTVKVSESPRKLFNERLGNGKKVIFFRIHYDSKEADALTKSKPDDHFANPNEYMWLYDGDNGLPIYMNAPYDFELRSLFILKEYTFNLPVTMNVSKSCNESSVSRVDFLRLVFRQLIRIVSPARLPDKEASAYVCYDINNRKNVPETTFMIYKIIGLNRQIILRYCCEVKDYHIGYNKSIDLCKGKKISTSKIVNLHTISGIFLIAFFPLAIGFISKAKLNDHQQPSSLVHSDSNSFENSDQYHPPFGTESIWLNERDPYYSFSFFVRWLLLFEIKSTFASRMRRSFAVILCLLMVFADGLLENFALKEKLRSYLDNNAPLGYRSMIFGFKKSAENTDYFLGGPFVWYSAFPLLGLIVINIPDRLCQTIAYDTLHQRETCTFLTQDINLLRNYGCLKVSNLHDYDLLHAILKSSLMTALNPSFWFAVIKRWVDRCKGVFNHFNNLRVIYQLMGVCVTFLCVFLCFFLCVFELLLCIVYLGCPLLQIIKAIPLSYTQFYICPLFRHLSLRRKILGALCFILFLPIYILLSLFSIYILQVIFELFSSYITNTVIALIAKPDALAIVIVLLMFVYFLVSIAESISETYLSLQKLSITLAQSVCEDFVYIRLGERFIYRKLFERIVQKHHPIRFEIAKALIKLAVAAYIFGSCEVAFQNIPMNMSTYLKTGLLIITSMIPKFMSVLKDTMLESRWKALPILETIYMFQRETNFPQNIQMANSDE